MNNKGFTLVEVLAVLVILVVIMSIAIPNISSSFETRNKNDFEKKNEKIKLMVELYLSNNINNVDVSKNECFIETSSLIKDNYIEKSDIEDKKYIIYNRNNNTIILADDTSLSRCVSIWRFYYTRTVQEFIAPVTGNYLLNVWGAQGGTVTNKAGETYYGGKGGYSNGKISLNANDKLYIVVGGKGNICTGYCDIAGGYNGGGSSYYYNTCGEEQTLGSGGGATHIARDAGLLKEFKGKESRIIIVAGGGGAANYCNSWNYSDGGYGGGVSGGSAKDRGAPHWKNGGPSATGGTQTDGFSFGDGFNKDNDATNKSSIGGGGGYYGGKGSAINGAGGGSGYLSSELTEAHTNPDVREGNGYATITLVN